MAFPVRRSGLMPFALTGRAPVCGQTTSLNANELGISHFTNGYEFFENGLHSISPLIQFE